MIQNMGTTKTQKKNQLDKAHFEGNVASGDEEVEEHQMTSSPFRKQKFEDDDGLTKKNPRERYEQKKSLRKEEYQRKLTKRWLGKYSEMSHNLSDYYKKSAINHFLVERYC